MVAVVDEIKTTKKRINSKNKGKRGELLFRHFLREAGFLKSYRSKQYCGGNDSADVICPELPNYHFEVKFTQKFNAYDALWQAMKDCGYKTPVVSHKRNNCEWMIVMRGVDWVNLVKDAGYVKTIFCPDCKSPHVRKRRPYIKGGFFYDCLNEGCARQSFIHSD